MIISDEALRAALDAPRPEWRSVEDLRDAAVLAPLFRRGGRDHLLFTVRHDDLPHHPGEVSFPGGSREGDEDALTCALRETREEIGVGEVVVLGRLPERRSSAGFCVHAFVGRIAEPDNLRLDRVEVAAVLEIPLAELKLEDRWKFRHLEWRGSRHRVPFFDFAGHTLWGLTARLTLDLVARLG